MQYHAFNIGSPKTDAWWRRHLDNSVVTVGFDDSPLDKGKSVLDRLTEGDKIIAYVNGFGFVGAAEVGALSSYRFVQKHDLPEGWEGTHRHWRGVKWIHAVSSIRHAVEAKEVGRQPPRQTREKLPLEDAIRLIEMIAARPQAAFGNRAVERQAVQVFASNDVDFPEQSDVRYGMEDAKALREVAVRRGQLDFRRRLLEAWGKRCVVTESRVEALLEAAHITPHTENVDYRTANGLLLRADIHTLFDLRLLSIDEDMRIHIDETVINTEYRQYHGKKVERRPPKGADSPSVDGLKKRHERFKRLRSSI